MKYDPIVREFMITSSKLLRKGARRKDPKLMWAILVNIEGVLETFLQAAEEQYLVTQLREDIKKREEQETKFRETERQSGSSFR
jgi:hypothetical protein